MTQQEIYENMTKGEWNLSQSPVRLSSVAKVPFKSVKTQKSIGGRIISNAFGADLSKVGGKDNATANAAAIASAVNNTYGKGINPESVEKMYETLKLAGKELAKYTSDATVFALTCLIDEALTTAKL